MENKNKEDGEEDGEEDEDGERARGFETCRYAVAMKELGGMLASSKLTKVRSSVAVEVM